MKNKKNILALVSLIALFVIAGCQKPPAPVPTPAAPVISITGVPTAPIVYADSVSFSWEISGKVDSTLLNGVKVAQNGSFTSGRLLADQDYTLRATGPGGSDSKTVTVKVGDWTTSTYGMISHSPWIFDSLGYNTYPGNSKVFTMYTDQEVDPQYWDDQYNFLPNGTYTLKSRKTGEEIIKAKWSLSSEDSLYFASDNGVSNLFVKKVTLSKMVLIETGTAYDAQTHIQTKAWFKLVYKKDNSN